MATQGSIASGAIWRFVLSILLFWLPLIGSILAGLVGGKKAGGVGNAILAVFLPGLVLGVLLTNVRFDVVDSKGLKGPLTVRV